MKYKKMKSKLICKCGDKSLLAIIREDGSIKEYVSCSYYEPSKEFGIQWSWGHYFETEESAILYWVNNVIMPPKADLSKATLQVAKLVYGKEYL